MKIQVVGRLLQYDDTGPLSSELASKFIEEKNHYTCMPQYLFNLVNFIHKLTLDNSFDFRLENNKLQIEYNKNKKSTIINKHFYEFENQNIILMTSDEQKQLKKIILIIILIIVNMKNEMIHIFKLIKTKLMLYQIFMWFQIGSLLKTITSTY